MLTIWYGGTFDPVHHGHLAIARAAADRFGVPVTLSPAAGPPHRAAPGADADQRAHMLDLAVAGDPRLRVDRRELRRPGPSWTVDTLRELRAGLGDAAPLALLLGADSFRSLPTWREWRQLPELAHFIVAGRTAGDDAGVPGDLPAALAVVAEGRWTADPADLSTAASGRFHALHQPLRTESATAGRRAIAAGDPAWRDWVPGTVAAFIDATRLYRDPL
ncbi:nicotinate-nucleotide adenylyltransferase [Pseudoxanthomonas koreensis]|uniref:nicotinate-nucleotide adenylyltransferase n=1 Tax=Pseudoxanthomonas koreensis TaxID=266061 RepID=UPI00139162F4|nr:nicotinate-nucleotide adenylyltransferase [Pseudoxanthomonas koreensis]KAF1690369.1 nicotinic acid mononucleotide adenylyltransferase [Pseudoxanthomonas koreensis]